MALAFDAGEDFAADKPACAACPKLDGAFSCTIHETLDAAGYSGCRKFSCLGAGQRVTHDVFAGQNWRDQPALMVPMAEALAALRRIHQDLELLVTARTLPLPAAAAAQCEALIEEHAPDTGWTRDSLAAIDASDLKSRTAGFIRSLRAYV
ncbi:hypothetical protein [Pararhodobacter sp.]|uniref:hypothetical protein n=1 Tax=Pararhodobacter sp. TaxID=2127056 RepID=UPI002AFF66F9|nr:hypothetical protein [Pararhodobacter sp.]